MAAPKGNKNAAKAKIWSDALRKQLVQGKDLPKIAKALIAKACDGDIQAIKEIGDRLDGKAIQSIEGQVEQSLTVEIIRFANPASK